MNKAYQKYCGLIEQHRKSLMETFDYLWAHPEAGYKEWQSSHYLEQQFEQLGYRVLRAGNIPGFIAELDTGRPGPAVAVFGELDALYCPGHPDADTETGAVHACGHLIQTTAMLGAAAALAGSKTCAQLWGKVCFVAVPAEETIDLEFRSQLIEKREIKYVAGKIEYLYRGLLDDIDMGLMFHAGSHPEGLFMLNDGMDGCLTKHIEYIGRAAHAGGAPDQGINALYAASLGLQACNALRETFMEKDYVRYHPVLTGAGKAANMIPDRASLDTYVRASSLERMLEVNGRINRALAGSAVALGASVTVKDKPGNLPLHSDSGLNNLCVRVIEELFGAEQTVFGGWDTQSSDIGDLSSLMPVIQPLCMGAQGRQHGEDYRIADKEKCIMNPARVITCMLHELLKDEAVLAKMIKADYQPLYRDKREYFQMIDRIEAERSLVKYQSDGSVQLKFD